MVDAPATPEAAEGATPPATTTPEAPPAELGDGGKKALDEERRLRKEAEKRAKQNETELQKLRDANLNEVDRALLAAKEEGRTEALREAGIGRVEDAVRAAAGGRAVDVDALLDGLDRTKFLDAEGNPDRDAVQAWIDRIAPPAEEQAVPGFPSLEQGTRTQNGTALNGDPLERALKDALHIR